MSTKDRSGARARLAPALLFTLVAAVGALGAVAAVACGSSADTSEFDIDLVPDTVH